LDIVGHVTLAISYNGMLVIYCVDNCGFQFSLWVMESW